MTDKINYWTELSEYDFITAEAMLETERFLYVGFMCHQCVEKILKAYYSMAKKSTPPYSHSLSYLAESSGLLGGLTEQQIDFLNGLEPLNIEARYPSRKKELLKSLSKEKCEELLTQTKEFQQWVKTKL